MAQVKTADSPNRTDAQGTMGCAMDNFPSEKASVDWAIFHSWMVSSGNPGAGLGN